MKRIVCEATNLQAELVEMRRTLHRQPEVGMDLPKTLAFIREELEKLGLEPQIMGQ